MVGKVPSPSTLSFSTNTFLKGIKFLAKKRVTALPLSLKVFLRPFMNVLHAISVTRKNRQMSVKVAQK